MNTTVTSKGQVTLPKEIRDAAGIQPGDEVVVRVTATGGVSIEKPRVAGRPETANEYRKKLEALADRRLISGATTDEIMLELRGDPAEDPKL